MFLEDRIVSLVNDQANATTDTFRQMRDTLVDLVGLGNHVPTERILAAVKEEVTDLCERGRDEVVSLAARHLPRLGAEHAEVEVSFRKAGAVLTPNTCAFPREDLELLRGELSSASHPAVVDLRETLDRYMGYHVDLEARVRRMLRPPSSDEVQTFDPDRDYNAIYHAVTYHYRAEREFFGALSELRPLMIPHINMFFYGTSEFNRRAQKRVIDTVLLFDNWHNWGPDSLRGRRAIHRINAIHGRYNIPNDSFKFILCNLIFVPVIWASRVGWRPFTEIEEKGWFNQLVQLGREMNLTDLDHDYDTLYAWWQDYGREHGSTADIQKNSFELLATQVVSMLPRTMTQPALTAMVAGMDGQLRRTLGYPEPPTELVRSVHEMFSGVGRLFQWLPPVPWFRSLQSWPIYPHGARVDELGVYRRGVGMPKVPYDKDQRPDEARPVRLYSTNEGFPEHVEPIHDPDDAATPDLPVLERREVARHAAITDGWIILEGFVYDVTSFLAFHPGGAHVLKPFLGKDGTKAFRRIGHSSEARVLMTNFRIGRIAEGDE